MSHVFVVLFSVLQFAYVVFLFVLSIFRVGRAPLGLTYGGLADLLGEGMVHSRGQTKFESASIAFVGCSFCVCGFRETHWGLGGCVCVYG